MGAQCLGARGFVRVVLGVKGGGDKCRRITLGLP